MTTWDNPKSDEGLKRYYDNIEKYREYRTNRLKEYNVKQSGWGEGTGKVYMLQEFESYMDYAKFADDEKLQKNLIHFLRLVNNAEIKVLRGSIHAPP